MCLLYSIAARKLRFKVWSCYLTMATPKVTMLNFSAMWVASDKLMCIANVHRVMMPIGVVLCYAANWTCSAALVFK